MPKTDVIYTLHAPNNDHVDERGNKYVRVFGEDVLVAGPDMPVLHKWSVDELPAEQKSKADNAR